MNKVSTSIYHGAMWLFPLLPWVLFSI